MPTVTRKAFLQSSSLLLASLVLDSSFALPRKSPLLSFSTLGCPDWTWSQIIDFAVRHGYSGLELRGLQRQLDLTQCPEFRTEEARERSKAQLAASGLKLVSLGSSASLHHSAEEERKAHLADAKRFIDLARQLDCPFVRVFPNEFPKGEEKAVILERISNGLLELGTYAKDKGVTVLLETHGHVVWTKDLVAIMKKAQHSHVGLVWDVTNMWTVTGEPPALAYKALKKFIRHTHIKDARMEGGKPAYTLLGEGEVPIFEAVRALAKGGYRGYYSFEWEKLWHPALAEPEVALAHYPGAFKKGWGLL